MAQDVLFGINEFNQWNTSRNKKKNVLKTAVAYSNKAAKQNKEF